MVTCGKYTITGYVENVAYRDHDTWQCYIAMSNGTDGHSDPHWRQYFFHAVRKLEMCEFAERCMLNGDQVKVYAKTDEPGANIVFLVERANTKSRYWMDLTQFG